MGAVKTTYQLTVTRLTGDGINGFWWAAKDGNNKILKVNWANPSAIVDNASDMVFADTFWLFMVALNQSKYELPLVEVNINVEEIADQNALTAQFEAPLLTNNQIGLIAANYDAKELCKKMGALRLVDRFYLNGHLTLADLSDTFIYLGQQGKATRGQVEARADWLLNNNHITQAQYDAFWTNWEAQVG